MLALTKSMLVSLTKFFIILFADNNPTATMVFSTSRPEGFIPNVPRDNDENGLETLVAVFKANEIEEKKNSKQAPRRKKRKLMSPDDVTLVDNADSIGQRRTALTPPAALTPTPTAPAVINEERQKIGQIVCRALCDKYDEHNRIRNTAKAYDPKIAEFKLWCRTFYNNDAMLMYQVTRGKVESFLTYNFFREAKPRGKQKGVPKGAPQLDYERANKIIKVYQSAKVNKRYQKSSCSNALSLFERRSNALFERLCSNAFLFERLVLVERRSNALSPSFIT